MGNSNGAKTFYVEEKVKVMESLILKAEPIISSLISKIREFQDLLFGAGSITQLPEEKPKFMNRKSSNKSFAMEKLEYTSSYISSTPVGRSNSNDRQNSSRGMKGGRQRSFSNEDQLEEVRKNPKFKINVRNVLGIRH